MQYTNLGRTGLKVSRLCLGTMNFGPETEEKDAFRIMDAALDAGINFFDTANVYGGAEHHGWTEEIIGRWFAQGEVAVNASFWRQRYMAEWMTQLTAPIKGVVCPRTKFGATSRVPSNVYRQTISNCIRCTMSTFRLGGTNCGAHSKSL
ncbi:hypothetical protein GCM10025859_16610 [Alicyclobacillus fastidiosus]|nr:hypothetical protein GCM10025859_16610 [Alicyclobacillus fastidiosus]